LAEELPRNGNAMKRAKLFTTGISHHNQAHGPDLPSSDAGFLRAALGRAASGLRWSRLHLHAHVLEETGTMGARGFAVFNQSARSMAFCMVAFVCLSAPMRSAEVEKSAIRDGGGDRVWEHGVGEGFRPTAQSIGIGAGVNRGFIMLGGKEAHHLYMANLSYSHMLGPVRGEGHWCRGNWELRTELFAGREFSPEHDWLLGVTPRFRYNLATGTRWVPFADVGAGVSATGIRGPDLGGAFQFNLTAGIGTHYFVSDHVALTFEARFMHLSSARIYDPNLGVNGVTGLLGLAFYF
jgi:lipid A 3-O-deacylase